MNYVSLNKAAVNNLLAGKIPPYAVVRTTARGVEISPYKIRRGDAQPVVDGLFPIDDLPENCKVAIREKRPLAVCLDDHDNIVLYPARGPLKSSQPSAKVLKKAPPTPVPENPSASKIPRVDRTEPVIQETEIKRERFLIKAEELSVDSQIVVPKKPQHANMETLEDRLMADWLFARAQKSKHRAPVEIANFTEAPAPVAMGQRRAFQKTIAVPVSFDRRRNMGTRTVEVMIKRRRSV